MRITAPRLFVPWRMSEVSVIPSEVSDKPKATPGPWKRGDCDSWIIWAPRYGSTGWVPEGSSKGDPETVVVAVVEAKAWAMGGLDPDERDAWLGETDATADLISAAPDLLAALKELLSINEANAPFGGEIYRDRIDRAWDRARVAAAKAEGRS